MKLYEPLLTPCLLMPSVRNNKNLETGANKPHLAYWSFYSINENCVYWRALLSNFGEFFVKVKEATWFVKKHLSFLVRGFLKSFDFVFNC